MSVLMLHLSVLLMCVNFVCDGYGFSRDVHGVCVRGLCLNSAMSHCVLDVLSCMCELEVVIKAPSDLLRLFAHCNGLHCCC